MRNYNLKGAFTIIESIFETYNVAMRKEVCKKVQKLFNFKYFD
jgi:hypothetical protein